jgi:hypothetical protein
MPQRFIIFDSSTWVGKTDIFVVPVSGGYLIRPTSTKGKWRDEVGEWLIPDQVVLFSENIGKLGS